MPELKKYRTISKNVASGDDLDFGFLRNKGLEYIEQLASDLWTDYNAHDPGITILEMLSYALTDLGARMEMPLENILAPEDEKAPKIGEQFFGAPAILPSKPVNEADYRKLFIDIEGVKNCWLQSFKKTIYADCKNHRLSYDSSDFNHIHKDFKKEFDLKGLYSVVVDFDELDEKEFFTKELQKAERKRIEEMIRKRFHENRNLCEDLIDILPVSTHPIAVCASIGLVPEADEEFVHAKVLRALETYFSPSIRFYSLKQMMEKGYSSLEIFEGPILENGFVDPKELEAASLRSEIRLSDLMQIIMDIEGVKIINDISINDCKNPGDETDSWLICLEEGKKPVLCDDSTFSYFKNVLPVNLNHKKVKQYVAEMNMAEKEDHENAKFGMDLDIPEGEYLQTSETTTIQNDFPDTYGIGRNGLPTRIPTSRKAQAKQLKGYLLFFDQILASWFAHLGKVKDLLSVNSQLKQTYFTQSVQDIKDFESLVSDYPLNNPEELTQRLLASLDNHVDRKNKLLDHLIARFAEKFSDYTFLMKQLYGDSAYKVILQSKQLFLKDYDLTSRQRGQAFNYYQQPPGMLWDTENVSGAQKRISRLAGIKNFSRRNLAESFSEIYEFEDAENKKVFRWRIRNEKNEIILTATENYPNRQLAQAEKHLAVVKIIETSVSVIEAAFEKEIPDESETGNFEIQISDTGKYSFNVLDREANPDGADRIIARQYTYYNTQEELKAAIIEIIHFMADTFSEEGIFLVEHILLRPDVTSASVPQDHFMPICSDDCDGCHPVDPYSFRVTVVLPGWTYRFGNTDFRNYLEELIRKELPAHVLARVCWIGYRKGEVPKNENDMLRFEEVYKDFLLSKTKLGQQQSEIKLKEFIKTLNGLSSVYPSGKLIDCDDENENLEGRIILGRTNIGNI